MSIAEQARKHVTSVTVHCIGCNSKREIFPGQVASNDQPMCEICFSPMFPIRATAKKKARKP